MWSMSLALFKRSWSLCYQLLVGATCDYDGQREEINDMSLSKFETEIPSTSNLSRNLKYKKVIGIGQKLAMVASECGMPDLEGNTVPLNLCSYTGRTMSKSVLFQLKKLLTPQQ